MLWRKICIFLSITCNFIITKYVNSLEIQDVKSDFGTIATLIDREELNMTKTAIDWSHWDDTYGFISGKNAKNYISNNLQEQTLTRLNLNIMFFTDAKGKPYYTLTHNIEKSMADSLVRKLINKTNKSTSIVSFTSNAEVHTGLLECNGKILILTSSPITMTNEKSKRNGSFVIGKYIDPQLLKYIYDITKNKTSFESLNTSNGIANDVVISKTEGFITAKMKLKDINSEPSIIATINMTRTEKNTLGTYLLILLVILSIAIILVVTFALLLMDKYLIKRFLKFYEFIVTIGKTSDITSRIEVVGHDEISRIADSTNRMLHSLDIAYSDMRKMDERFKMIMEAANNGYFDYNLKTGELYISPEWKRFIGYDIDTTNMGLIAEYISKIHPDSAKRFLKKFNEFRKGKIENYEEEYKIVKASGAVIWVLHRGTIAERDLNGNAMRIVGILLDITTRKNYEEEIITLGYSDKLTGLKNRAYVETLLEDFDKQGNNNYSIIMGDINGLKLTNDTFGHKEGDRLIYTIANIMKNSSSEGDIIARWGGDGFIILTLNKEKAYVRKLIKMIQEACEAIEDFSFKISIALGSAEKSESFNSETVMALAEERMYRVKLTEIRSSRNATIMSLELGKRIDLSQDELHELELLSLLHDIGKIGIPENILMKEGKLTSEEWETMKKHSEIGYRIAKATAGLSHVADEILNHHERYDGTGYPNGLKGEEIPILSRIINVVDSFDVMTHNRCYKDASSIEYAISELKSCSGTQFDPRIAEIFVSMITSDIL